MQPSQPGDTGAQGEPAEVSAHVSVPSPLQHDSGTIMAVGLSKLFLLYVLHDVENEAWGLVIIYLT